MTLTNPVIASQPDRLTTSRIPWADDLTLITVVHLDIAPSYAEVYKVTRAGAQFSIGKSGDILGKVTGASSEAYANGTVRLWVTQADNVAGSSGTTTKVRYYDFPSALPPQPPLAGGTVDAIARSQIAAVVAGLRAVHS